MGTACRRPPANNDAPVLGINAFVCACWLLVDDEAVVENRADETAAANRTVRRQHTDDDVDNQFAPILLVELLLDKTCT